MFTRFVAAAAVTLVLVLGAVGPVFAAGAGAVEITVTGINGVETFTTTGGVLCASGTSVDSFDHFGGSFNSRAGTFHGSKTLTCSGSGDTFTIKYDAAVVFGAPQDQGGWHLIGGTGAYAGCSGGGNLVGIYIPNGIVDHYTGRVHC
jgi:hypothetical protein